MTATTRPKLDIFPEVVDTTTRIVHRMTDAALSAGRHAGRYLTLCGANIFAASMTTPERARCDRCWPPRRRRL